MRIDPQIAALRRDSGSQRELKQLMQNTREDWRQKPTVTELLVELQEYGSGSDIEACPALARLITDPATASVFVSGWINDFLDVLKGNPLCEIPFQQSYSHGLSSMRIAGSGRANLALLCYEQLPATSSPTTASFSDREQAEIVLAGAAHGLHHNLSTGETGVLTIASHPYRWEAGDRIELTPQIQSRDVVQVAGRFVLLHLSRAAINPAASKSYSRENGALVQQSSGSKHSSQVELAIAVLGAMGREDAGANIAELAADGPAHLRWEALRHALALDAQLGFDRLSEIAQIDDDELSSPAQQLRERLIQSHPQLAKEIASCPA